MCPYSRFMWSWFNVWSILGKSSNFPLPCSNPMLCGLAMSPRRPPMDCRQSAQCHTFISLEVPEHALCCSVKTYNLSPLLTPQILLLQKKTLLPSHITFSFKLDPCLIAPSEAQRCWLSYTVAVSTLFTETEVMLDSSFVTWGFWDYPNRAKWSNSFHNMKVMWVGH